MLWRVLQALSLGGAFGLFFHASWTDASLLNPWMLGLFVASLIFSRLYRKAVLGHSAEFSQAQLAAGTPRAARVLDFHDTGQLVKGRQRVELKLLVDRQGETPFIANTQALTTPLETYQYSEGRIVTVVQPEPEYADVVLSPDRTAPHVPREFVDNKAFAQAVERAVLLPNIPVVQRGTRLLTRFLAVVAFLVGLIGGPLVSSPDLPWQLRSWYQSLGEFQNPFEENGDDGPAPEYVRPQVDEAESLFQPSNLIRSLEVLEEEAGSDRIEEVIISATSVNAYINIGGGKLDFVTVRDHKIVERATSERTVPTQPGVQGETSFAVSDVDWDGILELAPQVEELAMERGLTDPWVSQIMVGADRNRLFPELETSFYLRGKNDTTTILADSSGEIKPQELNATLPEEENSQFYFDTSRAAEATEQALKAMQTDDFMRISNQGSHVTVTATPEAVADGQSSITLLTRGGVDSVWVNENARDEAPFSAADVDWEAIFKAVKPVADRLDVDIEKLDSVTVRRGEDWANGGKPTDLQASIYFDDGGYATVDMTGKIIQAYP